jgi:hypothetical protein
MNRQNKISAFRQEGEVLLNVREVVRRSRASLLSCQSRGSVEYPPQIGLISLKGRRFHDAILAEQKPNFIQQNVQIEGLIQRSFRPHLALCRSGIEGRENEDGWSFMRSFELLEKAAAVDYRHVQVEDDQVKTRSDLKILKWAEPILGAHHLMPR